MVVTLLLATCVLRAADATTAQNPTITGPPLLLPAVSNLRVEYQTDAVAVATGRPRFSWELPVALPRGVGQKSYEVLVHEMYTDDAPVWISGTVISDSSQVACNATLRANALYSVAVRWASTDGRTAPAATAQFFVGPLADDDWGGAQWVGSQGQRQVRASFTLNASAGITWARMHIAAPGCHVSTLNGASVEGPSRGTGICSWTQFDKSILYQSYDISQQLVDGKNVLGVLLGHGTFDRQVHTNAPTAKILLTIAINPRGHIPGGSPHKVIVVSTGGPARPPPAPPSPPAPPGPSTDLCGAVDEHESLELSCPPCQPGHPCSGTITNITFASFGRPTGQCDLESSTGANTFQRNPACDAPAAPHVVEAECKGKAGCSFTPACHTHKCTLIKGGTENISDPCHGVHKNLRVAASCGVLPAVVIHHTDTATSAHHHRALQISGGGSGGTRGDPTQPPAVASVWTATTSFIVADDPWKGCTTDVAAKTATAQWDTAHFPASKLSQWEPLLQTTVSLSTRLPTPRAGMVPITGVVRTLKPTKVDRLHNGDYVYHFPENFVGACRISTAAIKVTDVEGSSLVLQHSEVLSKNGSEGNRPIDPAWAWNEQRDTYTFGAAGTGDEKFLSPLFTWHGGQFVQVTATGGVVFSGALEAIVGLVTVSNLSQTGTLEFGGGTGSETLNGLQGIIQRSQTSNVAAGMPTDCPTRGGQTLHTSRHPIPLPLFDCGSCACFVGFNFFVLTFSHTLSMFVREARMAGRRSSHCRRSTLQLRYVGGTMATATLFWLR
eukprot:COSAG01_NODE_4613_length_4878_cov_6.267211_1_plen_782_part_00